MQFGEKKLKPEKYTDETYQSCNNKYTASEY